MRLAYLQFVVIYAVQMTQSELARAELVPGLVEENRDAR
jgi:hypothetical protein